MAINAPKTPQYRASERLGGINPRYADLRPARALGGAIINLGKVIEAQGDRMKKERDLSVSTEIYNSWRDTDRQQLSELLSRKGKDAVNLDAAYDEYFNKSMGEADTATENRTQQRIVTEALQQKREQNLDILARYTVTEGKRHLAQQEAGLFANTKADARSYGFATKAVEEEIGKLNLFLDTAHSGMDPEALKALKQAYRSEILFGVMQEQLSRAQDKPKLLARAAENLEAWREDLGEGYYKLRDNLEGETDKAVANGAVEKLMIDKRFIGKGGRVNHDKAAAWIYRKRNYESMGLTLDQAKKASELIQDMGSTADAAFNREKQEGFNSELTRINEALAQDDKVLARELLDKSPWIKNEYPRLYPSINGMIDDHNNLTSDDQIQLDEILARINLNAAQTEVEDIYDPKYSGIRGTTKDKLAARLRQLKKSPADLLKWERGDKYLYKQLDKYKLSWDDDEDESKKIHNEKVFEFISYIDSEEGQAATDAQKLEFYNNLIEKDKSFSIWDLFSLTPAIGGQRYESVQDFQARQSAPGAITDREGAIKYLEDNNQPTTEANINYILENAK